MGCVLPGWVRGCALGSAAASFAPMLERTLTNLRNGVVEEKENVFPACEVLKYL